MKCFTKRNIEIIIYIFCFYQAKVSKTLIYDINLWLIKARPLESSQNLVVEDAVNGR